MARWNLQPLTTQEIMQSGNAMNCLKCKKPRYVMWKAAFGGFYPVLTPMAGYCRCEEVKHG